MANFDTSSSPDSKIRYADNGTNLKMLNDVNETYELIVFDRQYGKISLR